MQDAQPDSRLPPEFQQLLDWVGQGVERMGTIEDEQVRDEIFALLEGVDILHRQALARLLEVVADCGGQPLLDRVVQDPVVHTLLDMYDLPPADERARVERALQTVSPYIQSHGGKLELLGVESGRVRVRLSGSCQSCPGSSVTLKRVVEEALRDGVPGFQELIAEAPPPVPGTPIQLVPTVLRRPRWVSVGQLASFPEGEMRAVWPEGQAILLVRLEGEIYAHQNACPPGSALMLHLGRREGRVLICPWHGCRYDLRTGKRLDADGKLGVLPIAVQDGEIRVAMGVEEVRAG